MSIFTLFQKQGAKRRNRRAGRRAVIIALSPVELRDPRHLFFRQPEIHDIKVVFDMIDVLTAGDYDEAHLRMPSENYLRGRFAVLFAKLGKDGFFHQALVAVTEGIP